VTDGFSNPIIGGGGALVYPSIHSPNFNVANPAASPTPSWAILKSGLAYFFGLVLSGGTITGPDYIINSSGIFLYSATPALGNLVVSLTPAAGVDSFGNVYGADLTVGTASNTQVSIRSSGGTGIIDFITNNSSFNDAQFSSFIAGAFVQTLLFGPSKVGHTDLVGIEYNSSDGSSSANGALVYKDTSAGLHFPATWDIAGFHSPIASMNGVMPGSSPAGSEAPHAATLLNGWTAGPGGCNGAFYWTDSDITASPAGTTGMLHIMFDITPPGGVGSNSVIFTLPSGWRPQQSQNIGGITLNDPMPSNSPSTPWLFVDHTNGNVQVTGLTAIVEIFGHIMVPMGTL
jgi:hypothetical protein